MCDTDLDLDLVFTEGAQVPAELPIDGQYAGVAWGRAEADVEAAHSG